MMNNNEENNNCLVCGGSLFFNNEANIWSCTNCGMKFTEESLHQYKGQINNNLSEDNNSFDSNIKPIQVVLPETSRDGVINCKCGSCGSEFVVTATTEVKSCLYCHSLGVFKEKFLGELPSYVIPFITTKEEARNIFSKLLKGKVFAPSSFNKIKNINNIYGVYVPFWLYDIETNGEVEFEAKDIIYSKDANYKYSKSTRFAIRKNGHFDFNKVLVDASSKFPVELMNLLEPYDLSKVVSYNQSQLVDYYVDRTIINKNDGLASVANKARKASLEMLARAVNHQYKKVVVDGLRASAKQTNYILLPIWFTYVEYKKSKYMLAINGQTGKVASEIPISRIKIIIWTLGIFIIIFGIIYLLFSIR